MMKKRRVICVWAVAAGVTTGARRLIGLLAAAEAAPPLVESGLEPLAALD